MQRIVYDPEEIWEVFQDEKIDIAEHRLLVAENDDFQVYLDCMISQSLEYVGMMVIQSGEYVIEEDFFEDEKECNDIFEKAFINYILIETSTVVEETETEKKENVYDTIYDKDGKLNIFYVDEIEQREGDLSLAVINFIDAISDTQMSYALTDEEVDEIKDHFIEYLYRKFGLSIYRPMELVMDNGDEVYEEYPYPKLRFENPIGLYSKTSKALAL